MGWFISLWITIPPAFSGVAETKVAQFAIAELNKLQHTPGTVATSKALLNADVQKSVIQAVTEQLSAGQQSLFDTENPVDVADIVAKTTALDGEPYDRYSARGCGA